MPLTSPAFPPGPYRFVNREYLIITYRTDPEELRAVVPEPLEITDAAGEIRVHPHARLDRLRRLHRKRPGHPGVASRAQTGGYTHCMFLNDEAPIAGGRELWGFPKKLANPTLAVEIDTLVGTLDYGPVRIATGTMGYKHRALDPRGCGRRSRSRTSCSRSFRMSTARRASASSCDTTCEDITVKGAWTGPAALDLYSHALAPVAELPVLEVVSATHIVADLTLGLGTVVHDYLA